MPTIGLTELIIILALALLIFGPKSIPKIGKAIGDGIREFKKSQDSPDNDNAGDGQEPPRQGD